MTFYDFMTNSLFHEPDAERRIKNRVKKEIITQTDPNFATLPIILLFPYVDYEFFLRAKEYSFEFVFIV
jgi:hypothetical protein